MGISGEGEERDEDILVLLSVITMMVMMMLYESTKYAEYAVRWSQRK